MSAVILWLWDDTNEKYVKAQCDENGYLKIDMSEISLDDLADVNVPTPTDLQGIEWDNDAGLWIPTSFMLSKLLTARGDMITRNATVPKRLAKGTEGHYLKQGADEPEWAAVTAGSTVIWKDVSERALSDLNRTTSLGWTTLDLTAYTSADAKFAIVKVLISIDSIENDGKAGFALRKNGTFPTHRWEMPAYYVNGIRAGGEQTQMYIVALDTGQALQYYLSISGTIQADFYLDVLGYIE